MKKENLKTGMVVLCSNNKRYVVMLNVQTGEFSGDYLLNLDSLKYVRLDKFDEDLIYFDNTKTIEKVYELQRSTQFFSNDYENTDEFKLLFDRYPEEIEEDYNEVGDLKELSLNEFLQKLAEEMGYKIV